MPILARGSRPVLVQREKLIKIMGATNSSGIWIKKLKKITYILREYPLMLVRKIIERKLRLAYRQSP